MRKIILFAGIFIMLLAFSCSGAESFCENQICYDEISRVPEPYEEQASLFAWNMTAEEYLLQEMLNLSEHISLSQYHIKVVLTPIRNAKGEITGVSVSSPELRNLISNVIAESPDLFYIGQSYSYAWLTIDNDPEQCYVSYITPTYTMNKQEIESAKLVINDAINGMSNGITDRMSDIEKALVIHDNICVNYSYSPSGDYVYDIYNMVVKKHGVCQAYTLMYKAALASEGINSTVVESPEMNHIWNLVELDGNYYHTDVTWDDPTPNLTGRASHKYFMIDDTTIQAANGERTRKHHSYTAEHSAADNKFANYQWVNSNSKIVPCNNKFYLLAYNNTKSTIYEYNIANDTLTTWLALTEDQKWYANKNQYYTNTYTGLSLTDDNKFLINTTTSVCIINPKTKSIKKLITLKNKPGDYFWIYGSNCTEDQIIFELRNSPNTDAYIYCNAIDVKTSTSGYTYGNVKSAFQAQVNNKTIISAGAYSGNILNSVASKEIILYYPLSYNEVSYNLANSDCFRMYLWDKNQSPVYGMAEFSIIK